MNGEFNIGLQEIAGNPNLTFIYFIGFVLITVLGARFCVYALWNRQASDHDAQASIWLYLALVGGAGALYGLVGVIEIVTPGMPPIRDTILLGFILVLALTMRLIAQEGSITGGSTSDRGNLLTEPVVLAMGAVVLVYFLGTIMAIDDQILSIIGGVGAIGFAGYGYWYGRNQLSRSMVQGTMLDTLLRHLLPVLAFGTFVPAIKLAILIGIDNAVILHVQIVFVIMTAATLMTANIKLRQNLARL